MYKRDYNFLNFKGKAKNTDEWFFGTPIKTENGEIVIINEKLEQTVIRRETLCQKTNTCDANDIPLYEGDLVATTSTRFNRDQIVGCVRFHEEPGHLDSTVNAWKVDWAEYVAFASNRKLEVIGNVYDEDFHDDEYLKAHWPDDWKKIRAFVEMECREEFSENS